MPSPSSRLPHELIGNLWDFHRAESNCFIVIPTNGVLKANGDAVMGAGLAKQAAQQFPTLPKLLGQAIRDTGNAVYFWTDKRLFTLPTKHHWNAPSELTLIQHGVERLALAMEEFPDSRVYCPLLGCGLGQLDWPTVRAAITPYVTDRMLFVSPSSPPASKRA